MNSALDHKHFFFGVKHSLLKKSWIKRNENKRLVLQISQKFSYSILKSELISSRCSNIDEIDNFLNPTLKNFFPHFSVFNDMDKAINRTFKAISNKENIAVLGDYDVDGLSSIGLIKNFFDNLKQSIFIYIPDRIKEGYGPNQNAIDKIKLKKISLLIIVDCGTNSSKVISYAKNIGIDIIVIDHHKPSSDITKNCLLINPKLINDSSGLDYLCATGITFIFLVFLNKLLIKKHFYKNNKLPNMLNFLDLVALATVCDVVPLVHLNRTFVRQGLKILKNRQNLGLKVLADESKLNKKPDEEDLGFFYGPRLNAGGRVGKADIGLKLLCTKEINEAEILTKQLNTFNYQRKLIEDKILDEINNQIDIDNKVNKKNSLVLYNDNWHEGVLGIIASRVKDKLNKPVFILSKKGNVLKGSGRSISNIDIGSFTILAKQKKIILRGGGHQMAAGVTVTNEKLVEFINFFEAFVSKNKKKNSSLNFLNIDAAISINGINDKLIKEINSIGPYGSGNPRPIFVLKSIKILKPLIVGDSKKHISFIASERSGQSIKCVAFQCVDNKLGKTILSDYKNNSFHLAGYLKKSKWKNKDYFELIIADVSIDEHNI